MRRNMLILKKVMRKVALLHKISKQSLFFSLVTISFLLGITIAFQTEVLTYYDEFTVWTISRQPLSQLVDTLLSEPHPPGFYLLLKALPLGVSPTGAKIFISSVSHSLLFLFLFINSRKKILEYFHLSNGFLLLFSVISFAQVLNTVKQEAISVPLLLLLVIYLLDKIQHPLKKGSHWSIFLLLFLIFNFGYISFLFGAFFTVNYYSFQLYKKHFDYVTLIPALLLSAYIVIYFLAFGKAQLFDNRTRFAWIESSSSSLFSGLSLFLTFQQPVSIVTDVSLMLFIALCTASILAIKTKLIPMKWFILTVVAISLLICTGYATNLFVRTRYMMLLYGLLCVLAGWGLLAVEKILRIKIGIFVIFAVFMHGRLLYFQHYQNTIWSDKTLRDVLQEKLDNYPTRQFGLLSHTPAAQLSYKLKYFSDNPYMVPVHPLFPNIFRDQTTITRQHLQLDGYTHGFDNPEFIKKNLYETGLRNFLYLMPIEGIDTYYDKDRIVLAVLSDSCHTEISSKQLYGFFDCWRGN